MKTFKTIAILTLVILAAGYLLLGGTFGSVLDTAWRKTTEATEDAIPLDFELDMVETELGRAASVIDAQHGRVAELEVGCEDLRAELVELEQAEREAVAVLRRLTDAYEATGMGARPAVFDGRQVQPAQVAVDLRVSSSRSEQLQREIALKRDLLQRREAALAQARNAVAGFVMRREELAITLESRRMDLESARLLSDIESVPDATGSLAAVERRLEEVGRHIRVARAKADATARSVLDSTTVAVSADEAYSDALAVLGRRGSDDRTTRATH